MHAVLEPRGFDELGPQHLPADSQERYFDLRGVLVRPFVDRKSNEKIGPSSSLSNSVCNPCRGRDETLLADTKTAENLPEQIIAGELTGDFA